MPISLSYITPLPPPTADGGGAWRRSAWGGAACTGLRARSVTAGPLRHLRGQPCGCAPFFLLAAAASLWMQFPVSSAARLTGGGGVCVWEQHAGGDSDGDQTPMVHPLELHTAVLRLCTLCLDSACACRVHVLRPPLSESRGDGGGGSIHRRACDRLVNIHTKHPQAPITTSAATGSG